jgi:hypothetical protein
VHRPAFLRKAAAVRSILRTPLTWFALAAITGVAVVALTRDDGGNGTEVAAPATQTTTRPPHHHKETIPPPAPGGHENIHAGVRHAVQSSPSPRLDPSQREIVRTVRAYVAALNSRDGGRVCALFVRGAFDGVHFPRDRGACAPSLSASIGYRDRRGFPVYDRSTVPRIPAVVIDGSDARVTATVVTRFADDREPSVEDDVVYLRRSGGRWLIVKPSATLYRAIGVGDIPPQAITPP